MGGDSVYPGDGDRGADSGVFVRQVWFAADVYRDAGGLFGDVVFVRVSVECGDTDPFPGGAGLVRWGDHPGDHDLDLHICGAQGAGFCHQHVEYVRSAGASLRPDGSRLFGGVCQLAGHLFDECAHQSAGDHHFAEVSAQGSGAAGSEEGLRSAGIGAGDIGHDSTFGGLQLFAGLGHRQRADAGSGGAGCTVHRSLCAAGLGTGSAAAQF